MKISKEVCVHHIEYEPVLLTVKEIYYCMTAHKTHQPLYMQGYSFYFHGSSMVMYTVEL